jgi:hypothetical protein
MAVSFDKIRYTVKHMELRLFEKKVEQLSQSVRKVLRE